MIEKVQKKIRQVARSLFPRPRPYTIELFEEREKYRKDYRVLGTSLLRHLTFDSAYDVGCGNGFLIESFLRAGKQARGIELSPAVTEILSPEIASLVEIGDFSKSRGVWDLVCCVEVAEHIHPRRSTELIEKLDSLAQYFIYFTAAQPGQTGHGHINCRPHKQWLGLFKRAGWSVDVTRTENIRRDLEAVHGAKWLGSNGFVMGKDMK